MLAKRILVVDDEPKIVEAIKSYFEKSGYIVDGAATGSEAYEKYEQGEPSLIIVDWMLPDTTGVEICRIIRKDSKVPIIILTAKVDDESILQGFYTGADDYVTKPFSPKQLVARADAILRRTEDNAPSFLSFGNGELIIDMTGKSVKKNGCFISMTPNEFKILSVMAKYPTKVFTREELIEVVSGNSFDGSDRIIDTHIKNIRQKLETDPKNPQFILTAFGFGYKFEYN